MMYSAFRAAAPFPFSVKLSTLSCVFMLTGCSSLMAQEPAPIYHRSLPPGGHVYPVTAEYQASSLPTTLATHGAPPTPSTTPPAVTIYAAANPTPLTPQPTKSDLPVPAVIPTPTTPVVPAQTPQNSDLPPETYTVQAGDNLFRIALNNGLGYRELAELNHIDNPNEIKVGQVLRLRTAAEVRTLTQPSPVAAPQTPPSATAIPTPPKLAAPIAPNTQNTSTVKTYPKAIKLPYTDNALTQISTLATGITASSPNTPPPAAPTPPSAPPATKPATPSPSAVTPAAPTASIAQAPAQQNRAWQWPTQGKVIARFTEQNKGIDIAGSNGQAIFAARDGKVVYSGTGLRGYGKLLILKHDQTFLSAYAHNRELLVKEGDDVKKGQKIAEMGNTDSSQYKLHFEIRRFGKPVDPLPYIGQP